MYHALVFIQGVWVSFGLHLPSDQWTNIWRTLRRAYGTENVECVYWAPSDTVADVWNVRKRAEQNVADANRVQSDWDAGKIPDMANDEGGLHLSRAIAQLQKAR